LTDQQTVLFVCLHGAGMSRIAAAYFLSAAPAGWHALSAGVEPADTLSATAQSLLAGTSAEAFLDRAPPRPIDAVRDPRLVVALRNPAIQYELASDERWDLTSSDGMPLRDEIRDRAEAFARRFAAQVGADP
jgi:protein-tyrosine-phosphatase